MIVGNGLLANAFYQYFSENEEVIIFAAGVSNSQEISADKFFREENLLRENLKKNKRIVYFSTCSIGDITVSGSPYVVHKVKMEEVIKCNSTNYLIFRLPQLVGLTENPNTLINFIFNSIRTNREIKIFESAKRNILDVKDAAKIATVIIKNGYLCKTINIANIESISPLEILKIFEKILQVKAKYKMIPGGSFYEIDATLCHEVASSIFIDFSNDYVENTIRKYYK